MALRGEFEVGKSHSSGGTLSGDGSNQHNEKAGDGIMMKLLESTWRPGFILGFRIFWFIMMLAGILVT